MVKIRLSRTGAKGQPYYRVVVVDSRRKRDGAVLEVIGHYNPRTEPSEFDLKKDRYNYWNGVGAQTTEPVLVLMGKVEPKRHQPKNKPETEATQLPITPPAEETVNAPEEGPEASPELAEAVNASESLSPDVPPEVIAETVENTTGVTGEFPVQEADLPQSQEEPVDLAEVEQEEDSSDEVKKA